MPREWGCGHDNQEQMGLPGRTHSQLQDRANGQQDRHGNKERQQTADTLQAFRTLQKHAVGSWSATIRAVRGGGAYLLSALAGGDEGHDETGQRGGEERTGGGTIAALSALYS